MIKNNTNQREIKGVKYAPATNHLIQSISHIETGNLIVYTNELFLSEHSFSNSLITFIKRHLHKDGKSSRNMILITPSSNACERLKAIIVENGFKNISIYRSLVKTTNFIIEKRNVLYGIENFLEHSETNAPSFTIKNPKVRKGFLDYTKDLVQNYSFPILIHDFDKDLLSEY